jgi:uncharacterized membrane protein
MANSYGWLIVVVSVLFFTGCAPGFMPMWPLMDPNSLMMIVLIVVIVFGLYLYKIKDEKQNESELSKRVKELEKELKEIKDKL